MSEVNYWDELSKELNNLAGAASSGLEVFFREFGIIQNEFVNGQVSHSRAVEAGAKSGTLALLMERSREAFLTT